MINLMPPYEMRNAYANGGYFTTDCTEKQQHQCKNDGFRNP